MKRAYSVTLHFHCLAGNDVGPGAQAHATRAAAHWPVLMAAARVWTESEPCEQTRRFSSANTHYYWAGSAEYY